MNLRRVLYLALLSLSITLIGGCAEVQSISVLPSPPKPPVVFKAPSFDLSHIRTVAALPLTDPSNKPVEYVESGNPQLGRVAITQYPIEKPGEYIHSSLSAALITAPFKLLERAQIAKLLDEQDLQLSLGETGTAVKVGKMLGADAVMFGEVHEFLYSSTWRKFPNGGFIHLGIPIISFSVRLVDVKTGQILWSCKCSDTGRRFLKDKYSVTIHDILADPFAARAPLGGLEQLTNALAGETVRALTR